MTNWITHTIEPWMPAGALKAKADLADIAVSVGWQELALARYNDQRFEDSVRAAKIEEWLAPVQAGDIVLHQFPTYMSGTFELAFAQAVQAKQARFALLTHDFEPLRVQRTDPFEWQLAANADLLIGHSPAMARAFQTAGVETPTVTMTLFDYLGPIPTQSPAFRPVVNYAGTWQKAPWLQSYQGPPLALFGNRPKKWRDVALPATVHWQGAFDPLAITNAFQAGYGLVWDADFDQRYYQSYTKVNAPHKASLYLKAGLPLIVWSQSALAALVQQEQLGLVINSLADLPEAVQAVNETNYQSFQANAQAFQKKISQGAYTKAMLAAVQAAFAH
ncbi:sugar transferase [Leuconostocaceae bacterium ESL0958]|nr:sugar transferase [Leuconostocaceae bacterium ESL0958]